jgi:colanic acid/amylovoran biosynthesis glycosyltransferase
VNQLRIAYFVNQYPKVSHTFIRREIQALERQGFAIQRIALRGWDADLADAEDACERELTRYALRGGIVPLIFAVIGAAVTRPVRVINALRLAFKMSIHADRPWPLHLVYFAEACRIVPWLKQFGASHIHAHFGSNSAWQKSWGGLLTALPYMERKNSISRSS